MRRIASSSALLTLASAAPASAQERFCSPQATADAAFQQALAARRSYGLNADPAYVREDRADVPVRRGHVPRHPGRAALPAGPRPARPRRGGPALPALARRRLRRLHGQGRVAEAAYLLVHFTRDPRAPRGAQARRPLPEPPQGRQGPLQRACVAPGAAPHRPRRPRWEGRLQLENTGFDGDSDRVDVELVTKRDDAAAYFRKHYGPVETVVIAARRPSSRANGGVHGRARRHEPHDQLGHRRRSEDRTHRGHGVPRPRRDRDRRARPGRGAHARGSRRTARPRSRSRSARAR